MNLFRNLIDLKVKKWQSLRTTLTTTKVCIFFKYFLLPKYQYFFIIILLDRKDHRNGIYRPKKFRHESRRGVSEN